MKIDSIPSNRVQIYLNQAEIIYPLDKLPLEFTAEDWNDIRFDSITLLGENVNITSETIREKETSFNGAQVYIRSPMSFDKTTSILVKGILIDEIHNLVKIEDTSFPDHQSLYFTVPSDQIFYLEQPLESKYYVNFTYNQTDSEIYVSYLRSSLHWHTQYQLNLNNDDSTLIPMANIRNDGKSSISINHAELIAGDINLHRRPSFRSTRVEFSYMYDDNEKFQVPNVEHGNELAGLYIFSITKSFVIDGKTNYILPMFRPDVIVERFGLISKPFSPTTNKGAAQRSYRLTSNQFLPQGKETDRIVGEISLPNIAANDKYEFSIGQDVDIIYKENVILISSTNFNETELQESSKPDAIRSTRSIYQINLQIKNFKTRSVTIQYEQIDRYTFRSVKLILSNNNQFMRDGTFIKSNITLNPNDDQMYSYTIEVIHS